MRLATNASPIPATQPRLPGRPNVWPSDAPGVGIGNWRERPTPLSVGTEFGRGWNGRATDIVATATSDLYYQANDDAVQAASMMSQGAFLGAVSISWANFAGAELQRLAVRQAPGNGGAAAVYSFEALADTAAGREQLARTLKLDLAQNAAVDGAWTAVRRDEAGNVDIVSTADYLAQFRAEQPAATPVA